MIAPGFVIGGKLELCLRPDLQNQSFPPSPAWPKDSDEHWMGEALQESMKSVGITAPNPAVGCVLVSGGEIIAKGATERYGQRHAERVAIDAAPADTDWSKVTAYITLEPCSHQGQQPPCVEIFRSRRFARIVISTIDSNPLVNGTGVRKLREMQQAVQVGCLEAETRAWHAPFLLQQALGRPVIVAKWAQTLDGQLADDQSNWRWITGEASRSYAHWLRRKFDAVLVGAGTVLNDFPRLDDRNSSHGGPAASALRMVYDPRGKILSAPAEAWMKLERSTFENNFTLIAPAPTGEAATRAQSLGSKLNLIVTQAEFNPAQTLQEAMKELKLQSLMVEGGPRILSSLLDADAVDWAHVFVAPKLLGSTRHRIVQAPGFPRSLDNAVDLKPIAQGQLGRDTLLELMPASRAELMLRACDVPSIAARVRIV